MPSCVVTQLGAHVVHLGVGWIYRAWFLCDTLLSTQGTQCIIRGLLVLLLPRVVIPREFESVCYLRTLCIAPAMKSEIGGDACKVPPVCMS